MRPFAELTNRGKSRRLARLARAALADYDLDVARIRCLARDTNTIFRVDTSDGRRFALRVATSPDDTEVDTEAEVAWLEALARDTDLRVVCPIPARDGARVRWAAADGIPEPRKCVLFSWLPGKALGEAASPDSYHRLGRLAAALHRHGEGWALPADARPLVWDRVFYYPTEPVVLFDPPFRRLLTPARRETVEHVIRRAETELRALHERPGRFAIHGDLHPWNVHEHRAELWAFDFEDLMLGYPVQDVAITLFYNRGRSDYPALRSAFQAGYTGLRAWPVEYEGQLELLMAARTVMFINYVLRLRLEPDDYVPMATRRLRRYLRLFPTSPR